MALFNATKKQYGLHTHLLSVSLSAPATPMSVPSLLPELPPTPMLDATFTKDARDGAHHLNLTEPDVAQFSRFVREFVTMSLVPWMERCVLDWNETVSQCDVHATASLDSFPFPVTLRSTPLRDDYHRGCSLPRGAYLEVPVARTTHRQPLLMPPLRIQTSPLPPCLALFPDLHPNSAVSPSLQPCSAT